MEKTVASYRIDPALARWIKEKARQEDRKITTVLERILRGAQEREAQGEKEIAHAGN